MMSYQRYRFPPLVQAEVMQMPQDNDIPSEDYQSFVDAGFQQGMEQGYQAGYEQGKQAGWDEGLPLGKADGWRQAIGEAEAQVQSKYSGLTEVLESIMEAMKQQQDIHADAAKNELIELVCKVAQQVIRCELSLKPAQMLELINEAVSTLPASPEDPQVYLNPQDHQKIQALLPERKLDWKLIEDTNLAPGECRVTLGGHEVDAGCQYRLEACMSQLRSQLGEQ
ncbi:flagellar assembly protein FliH [Chromobacterium haemolyticum]|uniref:flagellar assembly protein FliH n=1 Tax=Chromobacterium haemolyticum TaxID=394935 RepID=UPI0009D9ECF0|nr:flagellar assembly protein FliH [Chromobacterium haemolyticum]OQS33879.1 hypothetical protein B0T39_20370 [Chromobacterium haemolyticum]